MAEDMSVVLMTGLQTLLHRALAFELLQQKEDLVLYVLAQPVDLMAAERFAGSLEKSMQARLQILEGSITSMNLGLESEMYRKLTSEITEIHHTAEETDLSLGRNELSKTNVDGTLEALELAGNCRAFRRFCHWSTAWVCGRITGVVMEDELNDKSNTSNAYERTKWEAESLVRRWARRLPVTILRPVTPSGNSKNGSIDEKSPIFKMLKDLISPADRYRPFVLDRSRNPIHMAPVDFLARAGTLLGRAQEAASRTFHLVDANPISAYRFCELVERKSHRTIKRSIAGLHMKSTGARMLSGPAGTLVRRALDKTAKRDSTNNLPVRPVLFNAWESTRILQPAGVICPPAETYIESMVRHVEKFMDQMKAKRIEDIPDPLA